MILLPGTEDNIWLELLLSGVEDLSFGPNIDTSESRRAGVTGNASSLKMALKRSRAPRRRQPNVRQQR